VSMNRTDWRVTPVPRRLRGGESGGGGSGRRCPGIGADRPRTPGAFAGVDPGEIRAGGVQREAFSRVATCPGPEASRSRRRGPPRCGRETSRTGPWRLSLATRPERRDVEVNPTR
jgi:hypothetical protein